jgi:hypothetical protein
MDPQADDRTRTCFWKSRHDARNGVDDGRCRTARSLVPYVFLSLTAHRPVFDPQLTVSQLLRIKGDVELIMKTIIDTEPWLSDPSLVPVPWNPTPFQPTRLKVGYFTSDGVVTPQPPIVRAMKAALDALREREDVELVTFEPYRHRDANKLAVSPLFARP